MSREFGGSSRCAGDSPFESLSCSSKLLTDDRLRPYKGEIDRTYSLLVVFPRLNLAGIFGEVMDVPPKRLHVLAGVFERLTFRFRDHLVLISGAGSSFELHSE